ncbi:MAG TPA: flagellar type III secretion system pore protein FliP [Tepidisphaeraceae bacterium]|nr:flagellar type III secretion system pore protein FliP [Tepidisphaeraceae bacterium]
MNLRVQFNIIVWALLLIVSTATAQETPGESPAGATVNEVLPNSPSNAPKAAAQPLVNTAAQKLPDLSTRENFSAAMQIIILLTVLSLAPAILIMMTSFTRIIIVLSLLRQALGTQQLPPNQVLIGLALFMTFIVMGPTWQQINDEALQPYMDAKIDQKTALAYATIPVREFMSGQIRKNGNDNDIYLFTDYLHQKITDYKDVGTMQLIPAFMLSELKTAFLMGFKVYLPFLIVDMVISSVLISMGMMMLPPVLISLPFKLLLFVLVDGWHLITSGLMDSFSVLTS